jgi:hypothetical protein
MAHKEIAGPDPYEANTGEVFPFVLFSENNTKEKEQY